MADWKLVDDWLFKADEDYGFASCCLEDELEYFGHICFHFQQAAEKYLKAFVVAHDLPFRKIHNLLVLLDTCVPAEPALEALRESCQLLNRYYVDTRYPVHWPTNFTKGDAEQGRQAVADIATKIKQVLGSHKKQQ